MQWFLVFAYEIQVQYYNANWLCGPQIGVATNSLICFFLLVFSFFVQHVPRINGDIPSVDEATLDHQRLLDRSCFFPF